MKLPRSKPLGACLMLALPLTLAACQQQPEQQQAPGVEAAPEAKPGIAVSDGVLVLPAVAGRPGAAYFALTNGGQAPATLAAISIDGAGKSEMHETKGGTMTPMPSLELQPGETVRFERGGRHVMAFDLADSVQAGGSAEMTLTFGGGDKVSTPLRVETMTGAMPAMDHGDHD